VFITPRDPKIGGAVCWCADTPFAWLNEMSARETLRFAPGSAGRAAMQNERQGRDFIARHGETVFNLAGRMQGDHLHTPLTRAGFVQADAMGAALREILGVKPKLTMWSSSAGRALQTLAVIAEHLELDWHQARHDDRLVEIGMGSYSGRYYSDVAAEAPGFLDVAHGLYTRPPPGGEFYDQIAVRVSSWLADTDQDPGDRLVLMHGMSSRILRGVMTGRDVMPQFAAAVAPDLPQGSIVRIEKGVETIVHTGTGRSAAPA
jgi:broad specificity phosphatase PhoE